MGVSELVHSHLFPYLNNFKHLCNYKIKNKNQKAVVLGMLILKPTHHCQESKEQSQSRDEISKKTHIMWIYFSFYLQQPSKQKHIVVCHTSIML